MGEFDHVPTPDSDELQQMFEAEGGVAAQSVDDLHEAAARESLRVHQERQAANVATARENVEQAAGHLPAAHAEQLRAVRLNREFTAQAEAEPAPAAVPATHPAEAGDTLVKPADQKARSIEEARSVLRGIQLPSYWKPEAKQQPREPLHRRAARFIGSKLRGKPGKHEKS